uniref:Uncharacterized protein n=1 Tax=Sparus aurata TaxID=8175 RepID=A0A671TLB8_SPAAU
MSGSMYLPEIGAALFRSPTSSSNSEANTDDGLAVSSVVPDASFRCCR